MHRSVKFSEIFSSTLSADQNRCDQPEDQNVKRKFIAKIGIGLIEFLLSSIYLCYGIIFTECVGLGLYTVENGLWTTVLYTAMWSIADPWSRLLFEYFEDKKYNIFRYTICSATICLFAGIVMPGHILCYGIFGGVFSNLISSQLRFMATERFDTDIKVFEGNVQVARALSLLIMPHFMLFLVTYFTMNQIKLVYAAFLLNVLPAALIIKRPKIEQRFSEISRYSTLPGFSSQMREMMEFANPTHRRCSTGSKRSESSTDEDEEEEKIDVLHGEDNPNIDDNSANGEFLEPVILTPNTVQNYYKIAGVSILPGIPEECDNESELEDSDIDKINWKRLSKISTKLEELNQQEKVLVQEMVLPERRDSIKEILNINDLISSQPKAELETIQNIEYIPDYNESNGRFMKDFWSFRKKSCCYCTPYKMLLCRVRLRAAKDFILDTALKPFIVSVTDLHFYPTLISKIAISLLSTMFITLAPYIAATENKDFQIEDETFLLSYIAFSWCLFLVILPMVLTFSNVKLRITFICGLLLTGSSMILMSSKMNNHVITISCLLFGFGYGAISFTEYMVYRSFIGVRKWKLIRGTLETTSAFFVILSYYIIYLYKIDISVLLFAAFATYFITAFIWIIAPIFKTILSFLSNHYWCSFNSHNSFL